MSKVDEKFFDRVNATIEQSNNFLANDGAEAGGVSASTLYAASRFNAWVSAHGFDNPQALETAKAEIVEYYVNQYKLMLEENIDDHIKRFNELVQR